jgi:acyl-CoA synthetase (NDP forming)
VREPERYVAALDRAADRGKPVIVLKVGKSERTRRAVTSHTGGLAGESRVFSELLRAHRAIEVDDLDMLAEVLAVCQGRVWPHGRRIAVITASGGQAELILDLASGAELELPPLPAPARAEVERVIGPITGDGNPLDAWGNGDFNTNFPHAFAVLADNPTTDAIALCSDSFDDQPMGRAERPLAYAEPLAESAQRSAKPHYMMTTRPGMIHREQLRMLASVGVPVICGTRQGLGAIDLMARYAAPRPAQLPSRARLAPGLAAGARTINEFDAKQLLAAAGLPVTRERLVHSLAEAQRAADALGYPVVLKAVSDDLPHKSELGLVAVGLADAAALGSAWDEIAKRLAAIGRPVALAGLLVQEMVEDGIEMFAGIGRDPDFGLALAVGMGGVAIEIHRDFAMRLLPLHAGDAAAMIAETRGAALLGAVRGRPAADVAALETCIEALADFAWVNRARLAEIDLNPIKVRSAGKGCVVVDALIVTTPAQQE